MATLGRPRAARWRGKRGATTARGERASGGRGARSLLRWLAAVLGASVLVLALLWAWDARGGAHAVEGSPGPSVAGPFDQDHAAWRALLERYVHQGSVDYAGLKRNGQVGLSRYLSSLESVTAQDFASWSREQRLAFWINAYNAYTVRLILDHYPLESIRSIGVLPGAAFRREFIPLQRLRGHTLSLQELEHQILRAEFHEPLIHFAIVCASKSCPTLRSQAYRASTLAADLEIAARAFLRDRSKNRYDATTRTLYLSSIFQWFREDFQRDSQSLTSFIARYADAPTSAALRSGGVRLRFLDYDWSLNGR